MPKRDPRLPPGPRWSPLGQLRPLRRDMIGFLAEVKRQYGDYAFFNIGHLKVCLISEPEGVRTVLVTNQKNFVKGRPLELARELLGEGLLTAEGEHHLRHRRMIQPLLYRSRLPGYADAMVESAAAGLIGTGVGVLFGIAMALSSGIQSPLDASVFSASAAALLLSRRSAV